MRRNGIKAFISNEAAAIAPMYAIALFGLVGIAGVGFDYGRLMSMDSELQNAADQAALAAATQLDGREGAMLRARDAASDYLASADSQWVNQTRMSNDGEGRAITADILTFRFYESYDGETDTFGNEITDDEDAEDAAVVSVTVNGREVFYALTPIVGAISSGDIAANAVAGLETATCNVPPLMFCAPNDDFPTDADIGKGMRLHMRANEADIWAPGNFGFLDIDYVTSPSGNPNTTLGWNASVAGCVGEAVESRTGSRTPEMRALNTRFDRYDTSAPNCNSTTGDWCPAQNVRKNFVREETRNGTYPTDGSPPDLTGLSCDASGPGTWIHVDSIDAAYRPTKPGLPPDSCVGCDQFGNGSWDSTTYFQTNYGSTYTINDVPDLDDNGSISRYEVYKWEISTNNLAPKIVGAAPGQNANRIKLYCSYPAPVIGTPVVPSTNQKDRRLVTVASVDCTGLNGHAEVDIIKWVDLFLVQSAEELTDDKSFYAEVKGPATRPGGGQAFQYYGRNKAVLLR